MKAKVVFSMDAEQRGFSLSCNMCDLRRTGALTTGDVIVAMLLWLLPVTIAVVAVASLGGDLSDWGPVWPRLRIGLGLAIGVGIGLVAVKFYLSSRISRVVRKMDSAAPPLD